MNALEIHGLGKEYGSTLAVERLDLTVKEGEFVSLLGPSGCGKTTTLRMVAGFIAPTRGQIVIHGQDVTAAPPHARDTALVFQSYALFPHMTVAQNVSFGLEMRKVCRAEREGRVMEALRRVRLEHLVDRYPRQLSGGQQQRVALARALVVNPAIFLLDEPLSNLDAKLRGEVRSEIRALQQDLGLTTLMVTHDQEEALTMSDRLVLLNNGVVSQTGTAEELYEEPANLFVADFVGRSNLIPGKICDGVFRDGNGNAYQCREPAFESADAVLVLRPERVEMSPEAPPGGLSGVVTEVVYLGGQTEYAVNVGGSRINLIRSTPPREDPMHSLKAGDPICVHWKKDNAYLLPKTQNQNRGASCLS